MISRKNIIASVLLAFVSLIWGTSYAVIKDTLNHTEPFTLMAIRFVGAVALLAIIYFKKLLKIDLRDLKNGSIIGLALFGSFFFLVKGIQYTDVSKQSFLIGSFVIMVPFLRWLINKKKPDVYSILSASFALIGLAMLTLGSINGINKGDIYSLFSAFFFGLHIIVIEKYSQNSDPIILSVIQFFITAFLFLLLSYKFENFEFSVIKTAKISVAYLVIVSTVIGFVVQNIVQKILSSTTTALILTLESAFGSLFAIYYLKEKMSFSMIFACVIILIAIITQETKWSFLKFKYIKME